MTDELSLGQNTLEEKLASAMAFAVDDLTVDVNAPARRMAVARYLSEKLIGLRDNSKFTATLDLERLSFRKMLLEEVKRSDKNKK